MTPEATNALLNCLASPKVTVKVLEILNNELRFENWTLNAAEDDALLDEDVLARVYYTFKPMLQALAMNNMGSL